MGKVFLILLAVFSMAAEPAEPLETENEIYADDLESEFLETQLLELDSYIDGYLGHYTKRAARSKFLYAPIIVDESKKHGLDPLLMAVIVSHESSWVYKSKGKKNEGGLFQIMPGSPVRRLYRVNTIEGNIRAGIHLFNKGAEICRGPLQALTIYQSGHCKPVLKSAKRRWRRYQEALHRHGRYDRGGPQ